MCLGLLFGAKRALEFRLGPKLPRPPTLTPLQAQYHADSIRRLSFGFDHAIASLLWVRLLQQASHEKISGDRVSWEYAQLAAIVRLNPGFLKAYSFGSAFLSVFRQDVEGATRLLRAWVARQPTYWRAQSSLGYHLFAEAGQYEEASRHILLASQLEGAPPYLASLGVRLLSEKGLRLEALRTSIDLYADITDPEARERLEQRIVALTGVVQREAWEKAVAEYRTQTGREPATLGDAASYYVDPTADLHPRDREIASEHLSSLLAQSHRFRYDLSKRQVIPLDGEGNTGIYRRK